MTTTAGNMGDDRSLAEQQYGGKQLYIIGSCGCQLLHIIIMPEWWRE
jgi:hypothetical protein